MAYLKIKNRAVSALAADITSTATSLSVTAGEGAKFPASGDFHVTCEDEIVKVTARSTDTLTVVRAQEGTTGAAHVAGKSVELRITAGVITNVEDELNTHAGLTNPHSATDAATASRLVLRDAAGRAKFAAPAASGDTLIKGTRVTAAELLDGTLALPLKGAGAGANPAYGRLTKAGMEWTANKLLKGAGAGANPTEIDVPSGDFFADFRDFVPWLSLDGFVIGGDTGYVLEPDVAHLIIQTGATADYDAYCYSRMQYWKIPENGKAVTVEFIIQYLKAVTDQNIWLRMAFATADPPDELAQHFGWKIIGGDLYASNASTAQTITDTLVDLQAAEQRTRLKMVWVPGTDLKFYVDDVLKVTHTTNLPTILDFYLHFHVRTLIAAGRNIYLGRVLIEKVH